MAGKQYLDWQTMPRNPADAWRAIAEIAFPGFEVDEEQFQRIRDHCEEPVEGPLKR